MKLCLKITDRQGSIMKKCPNQSCLILVPLFLFWVLLLYLFHSISIIVNIPVTFFNYNFEKSAKSPESVAVGNRIPNPGFHKEQELTPSVYRIPLNKSSSISGKQNKNEVVLNNDPCSGRYIYMHDLPSRFNTDLLASCGFASNLGLGPHLPDFKTVDSENNTGLWFATNQFSLEVIFHNKMMNYKCLTKNSSMASAVFVPNYAGLDVGRYLWGHNTTMRDSASLELVKWLREKPEWMKFSGRDHFMVNGRITWDFRRTTEEQSDWGNNLLNLPESKNMTILQIESSPWAKNDFAIPYPTYFHPSSDQQVFDWQNKMRKQRRRFLFSFAGASRPNLSDSIRTEIINQCKNLSKKYCMLLECNSMVNKCYKPVNLMKLFQRSVFCLQPPGDSYTRRSAFDSILAGCIPVFFHPGSAYAQYIWHLPKDYTKYSVFIPASDVKCGKVSIKEILIQIPKWKAMQMREEVIRLILNVVYANPKYRLETVEDAFDIAVREVLERVKRIRREMEGQMKR